MYTTASYIKDINNIFIDLFQVDQKIFAERKIRQTYKL